MLRWLLLLALTACERDRAPATSHTPSAAAQAPSTSKCAQVADHVIDMAATAMHQTRESMAEGRAGYLRHCEGDHWSVELQECLLALKSPKAQGEQDCDSLMTEAQRDGIGNMNNDGKPMGSSKELEDFGERERENWERWKREQQRAATQH